MNGRLLPDRLWWGRALGVAAQLCAAGLLLTSAWLIVRAAQQPPVLFLMVAIVGVRFFGVARTVLRYAERLVTHDVALREVVDLRIEVYRALEQRAGHLADDARRGDLVRRVVADVDAVQDRLLRVRGPWVVASWTVVIVSIAVALVLPAAGVAVLAGSAAAMLLVRLTGGDGDGDLTEARGALAAEVSTAAVSAPDLVVAGAATRDEIATHVDRVARLERRAAWGSGRGQALVLIVTAAVVGGVAALAGSVDPVMVGVLVLAPLALAEPLEALADAERLRPEVEAAERRLRDLLDAPTSVVEVPRDEASKPPSVESAPLPDRWDLRLEDVTVGWDAPLVSGIDLDLRAGSAVAVTGPSGVGKSTLGLTLTRFVPHLGGRITLGGVDVTTLSASEVRTRIGRLGQDEMVFDTTVRENLRIAAPDAADARLEGALRDAGLGEWLDNATSGLDTLVGERGSELSGGERQRLCLARLLLAGHRILVLDEPTEHLDDHAAHRLLDDLLALRARVSLVIITHDPRVIAAMGHEVRLAPLSVAASA